MTKSSYRPPQLHPWLGLFVGMSLGCLSLEPLSSYSERSPGVAQTSRTVDAEPPAAEMSSPPAESPAPEEVVSDDTEAPPLDAPLALAPSVAEVEPPVVEPPASPPCVGPGEFASADGGSCYLRSTRFAAWADALSSCQTWGGQLVTIDSREEDAFLAQQVGTSFWIGANDRLQEGLMVWSAGGSLVFSNWAAGEPNDFQGREDCVVKTMPVGSWNDLPCANLNAYVCERNDE